MYYNSYSPSNKNCITLSMQALRDDWRMLWEQHVAWTRMTILSAVFNSPDLAVTSARLLRNPDDMGVVMRVFYGDAVAAQFTKLMHDHLQIAINLVVAAKAGNTAQAAQIEKQWYANADEIAHFMASINPYWQEAAFRDMLHQHLVLTKTEAVATLSGDYQKSVNTYDQIELQALEMADAISSGIIAQFRQIF